jgi:hypothetical protein
MKWREPKIKGMVTLKNILAAFVLIFVVSIPFGFWGGNGKFSTSIYFLAVGFMSIAVVSIRTTQSQNSVGAAYSLTISLLRSLIYF